MAKRERLAIAWCRVGLMLLWLVPSNALAQTTDRMQQASGLGLELRVNLPAITRSPGSFGNFPLATRTVPSHPDDGYIWKPGTPLTIPDSVYTTNSFVEWWGGSVAAQYAFFSRFIPRVGVAFRFGTQQLHFADLDNERRDLNDVREINQNGRAERGSGNSLVYYVLRLAQPPSVNPFYELEIRTNDLLGVLVGYARARQSVLVENGYDRFNEFEEHATTRVGSISSRVAYVGIRFGAPQGGIRGSIGHALSAVTPTGDGTGISMHTASGIRLSAEAYVTITRTR